jgi:hypothetical protein
MTSFLRKLDARRSRRCSLDSVPISRAFANIAIARFEVRGFTPSMGLSLSLSMH